MSRFADMNAAQIADLLEHGGAPIDEVAELCRRNIALLREYAAQPSLVEPQAQEPICHVTVHRGTTPDLDVIDISTTNAQHDKLLGMDGAPLYAAPVSAVNVPDRWAEAVARELGISIPSARAQIKIVLSAAPAASVEPSKDAKE